MAALALGLLLALPVAIGNLGFISLAMGQGNLTKKQADALNAYNEAVKQFESVLGQRRAQINSKQPLPNLPGQALYLARNNMLSAYKDLTDVLPSKIGGPNKFKIPPAYFDAKNEPLLDEYVKLFALMQAPPANAQNSETPFKDVVDLGIAIARAKGLDAADGGEPMLFPAGAEFHHYLQDASLLHLFSPQRQFAESYQAFTKLLRRWTDPLIDCLKAALRERMALKKRSHLLPFSALRVLSGTGMAACPSDLFSL